MILRLLFLIGVLAAGVGAASAQDITIPANDGYVTDGVGIITLQQDEEIERKIELLRTMTDSELVIIVVADLGGSDPNEVTEEISKRWQIGDDAEGKGIVLLVDHAAQQVYLSVGTGLHGVLNEEVTRGIVDRDVVPAFRDGMYFEGLSAAVDAISAHLAGEYSPTRYANEDESAFGAWLWLVALVIVQWLAAVLTRTKSWWLGSIVGGIGAVIMAFAYDWWLLIPVLVALGLALDFIVMRYYASRAPIPWWAGGSWAPGGTALRRRPRMRVGE